MAFKLQVPIRPIKRSELQIRFSLLAAGFLFLYTIAITLAPFIRNHSWIGSYNLRIWLGFVLWMIAFVIAQWGIARLLPNHDPIIAPIVYLLAGWGLLTIWRLSPSLGFRQNIWLLAGTIGLLFICWFPRIFELLRKYRAIWMVVALLLVLLTILPGILNKGAQPSLWLTIWGFTFQPSEPLKILLVAYLAAYFSDRMSTLQPKSWATVLPTLLILGITVLLLILQRDLGTASLVIVLYTFMIYLLIRKRRVLVIGAIILAVSMVIGYLSIDVIRLRIDAWLNPWADPTSRSYQIIQSLISIATGGLPGTGPGLGSPGLVPVAVSDFIFTAIAEETGLIGATALLVLILILFSRYIRSVQYAENDFNQLLVGGLSILVAIQSLLIIGGNIRLFPLTGVTLPYVSYGGSSLFINMLVAGIVLRTTNQPRQFQSDSTIDETLRKRIFVIVAAGFAAALLLLPVWSIIRKPELVTRGDNLRRALNDTYVQRGAIVDRNNQVINLSVGSPGSFQRTYEYPSLANTVGYADPTYGLSGLESEMDAYLRGSTAYPAFQIWWNNLLTSQNPPGLDIRLTVDLSIQSILDGSLHGHKGAGIILNANTGEILAVSSQPGFDPSLLETEWDSLISKKDTPLLNRAIHGKYPAGTTTGVFLYAQAQENLLNLINLSPEPVSYKSRQIRCAIPIDSTAVTTSSLIQLSCPGANLSIARLLGGEGVISLYHRLGWFQSAIFDNLQQNTSAPPSIENLKAAAIGQEAATVSPLQMALTAASISQNGIRPTPILTLAYQSPEKDWVLLPTTGNSSTVFSAKTVDTVQRVTALGDIPAWGVVGKGLSGADKTVTWFIGGTTNEWKGSPLAISFMIEEDDANFAFSQGKALMQSILLE